MNSHFKFHITPIISQSQVKSYFKTNPTAPVMNIKIQ
jgi:hypothetical protein